MNFKESARDCIKYLSKRVISLFLHIFWIFPINKNKILFMNDHSYTFSDNLKYLALYLLDESSYDIYFSLKNAEELDERIKGVRFLSLAHFYHALTSGVVITNNSGIVYLPVRKKQLIINTWHGGGPYKVTGTEALDNYWHDIDMKYNAGKVDYILSACRVFSEVEAPGMFYKKEQCVDSGMPRMDFFFNKKAMGEMREKVFRKYNIPFSSKLVMYAPTFRGIFEDYDGVIADDILEIDYKRLTAALKERFGGDWVFGVRLHPRLKDIKFRDNEMLNLSHYPDAEELLMAADSLITDYSSVMWDFSFSKNPVFVFATDINEYEVKRGFYIQPEEWPYPIATTNDELEKKVLGFNYEEYLEKLEDHYVQSGSFEKGVSCETVKKIIYSFFEKIR